MSTKRKMMKEKEETLVTFFTQIFPQKFIKALHTLVALEYPIKDKNAFRAAIEDTDMEEYLQKWLVHSFQPTDFGLDTAMNAMEKFNYRYNLSNESKLETSPNMSQDVYPSENKNLYRDNDYRTTHPSELDEVYAIRTGNFKQLTSFNKKLVSPALRFGKDACGIAAEAAWLAFVAQGRSMENAMNTVQKRSESCREWMPDYGTGWMAQKAEKLFATQFIVLGKNHYEADQSARMLMNQLKKRNFSTSTDFVEMSVMESFENELVYN